MAVKNKRKMALQKKKRVNLKIKKHERDDSNGVSRQKQKFSISPKVFVILKIISICLPIICYFLFSYALFFCMLFSAVLFIATILTERYHNKSFIKSNHIKIPKFDSVLAIIVMLVVIFGALVDSNTKMKTPMFEQKDEVLEKVENVMSCLTGNRRIKFTKNRFGEMEPPSFDMNFGTEEIPDDLPHMMDQGDFDFGQMEKPEFEFDLDDLPVELLFSTIISTITTILIFSVPASSIIVLVVYNKKRKKHNKLIYDVVVDTYPELTDEDYYRIFTFDGCVEEISLESEAE